MIGDAIKQIYIYIYEKLFFKMILKEGSMSGPIFFLSECNGCDYIIHTMISEREKVNRDVFVRGQKP